MESCSLMKNYFADGKLFPNGKLVGNGMSVLSYVSIYQVTNKCIPSPQIL